MLIDRFIYSNDNCVTALVKLVRALDLPIARQSIEDKVLEHPDHPSLLSISDALTDWKVKSVALKIRIEQLESIQVPFIAQMKEAGQNSFVTIKKIGSDIISYYSPTGRLISTSISAFCSLFTGIVLLVEADGVSWGEEHIKKLNRERRQERIKYLSILGLPLIAILAGILSFEQWGFQAFLPFLFLLSTLSGATVSILLIWSEIDQHNPVLQEICTAGKKTNCSAILQSKASKIAGISWSTLGFVYFTGELIYMSIVGIGDPQVLLLLSWLNLLTLPYIIFSLYYQWRVVKQWCVLCICVQAVLAIQCMIAFSGGWHISSPITSLTTKTLIAISVAFSIPFFTTTLFIPACRRAKENNKKTLMLQRLKYNPEVFNSILSQQKNIMVSPEGLGVILGNPNAPNKLIKVCNPYCGPCSKAHSAIEDLLQHNQNLQVQIIFTAANDETDIKAAPVKHLMAIAEKGDSALLQEALNEWYNAPVKDYREFAAKYTLNGELQRQGNKLAAMKKWCIRTGVSATPTFFLNGYQLPGLYNVINLKYLLI